jgi:hypothetical protein
LKQNLDQVYAKLKALETDLDDLRSTYSGVNKSYIAALTSLNELTLYSSEAAKRAAKSTEQSKIAALNAAMAAKEASGLSMLV